MSITFDSGHRQITDAYKVRTYIHIVQLLLEDEDATTAETYLNRASLLLPNVQDKQLQLQFKASQARISDFKRQVGLPRHETTDATKPPFRCAVLASCL